MTQHGINGDRQQVAEQQEYGGENHDSRQRRKQQPALPGRCLDRREEGQ
jgi:hypothetical protein